MVRIMYTMAFKKEVIEYINKPRNTAHSAWKYFSARDNRKYEHSMFTSGNVGVQRS
jgi:hypothetical protein